MSRLALSIVIPTYGRDQVLVESIGYLLEFGEQTSGFLEILVVDQTPVHGRETARRLVNWSNEGSIRWLKLKEPNLTHAMNLGLREARGDLVLFTDDDIIPAPALLRAHLKAYRQEPTPWAVVGQVLQPGEEREDVPFSPSGGPLKRYLDFPFRRTLGAWVENVMAGNLSVDRRKAIAIGGFDENFTPPVASRFETEFAKRLVERGGRIWFEPKASIRHLRAETGGTRSKGSHLNSASPRYGVGDYYYAMVRGRGYDRLGYILRRPFREIRTKYHLTHPWWIPLKFIGELRALVQGIRLRARQPVLIEEEHNEAHPL